MNITITINTDNAAFDEYAGNNLGLEVARILESLAYDFKGRGYEYDKPCDLRRSPLFDANGHTVGHCVIEES